MQLMTHCLKIGLRLARSHMVKSLEVEDVGLPDSEEAQEVLSQ